LDERHILGCVFKRDKVSLSKYLENINFFGWGLKFTPKFLSQVAGSESDPHAARRSLFLPAHADAVSTHNMYLPFAGDHSRSGVDLILSKDRHAPVVPDPFKGEKRSTPASHHRECVWPATPNLQR
jgi:hypothetical protein